MRAGESRFKGDDLHRRAFLQRTIGAVALLSSGGLIGAALRARASALDAETILSGNAVWPNGRTIAAGERVVFDPDVSTTIDVTGGNVIVEGTLVMRPGAPDITHTLRFTNVNEAAFVGGGNVPLASDRGLWVTGAGTLDVAGDAKLPWTRLTYDPGAGATTLTLPVDPVGWKEGDQIAITPTLRPWWNGHGADRTYDERIITAIAGRSVTLNSPLTFPHPVASVGRGIILGAEVLNLTRNVVIGGTAAGKSHIAIMATAPQVLAHTRIEHMGPRRFIGLRDKRGNEVKELVLGRYGLHLHRMKEASRGMVVDGVIVTDTNSRAFVAHDSHGVTLRHCIAHRTMYSQFWWDAKDVPDITNDVVYDRCVASARLSVHEAAVTPDPDARQAGFSLNDGSRNVLRDCVAVGGEGGIWSAGIHWEERTAGNWVEEGIIVSHNNASFGSFSWENGFGAGRDVRNLVLYHNGRSGIRHGAYINNNHYTNVVCFRNGGNGPLELAALSSGRAYFQEWRDCLFDAAGAPRSLTLSAHRTATGRPVRFIRCEFRNPSQAHVAKTHFGTSDVEVIEFINCTFSPGKPEFQMGAAPVGTEWRVQDSSHGTIALTPDPKPGSTWNPTWRAYVRPIPPLAPVA